MAIHLESILNQARLLPASPVRERALARLQQIGWPRSRHEFWTFFPLAVFNRLELAGSSGSAAAALLGPQDVSTENDIAALLPLLLSPGSQELTIGNDSAADVIHMPCAASSAHEVVKLAPGSRARILVSAAAHSQSFRTQRLDIFCAENSELELVFLQDALQADQLDLRHLHLVQEAASQVRILDLHAGLGVYRGSVQADLQGAGASLAYRALSLVDQQAHSHRHLTVNHLAPECSSTQFVRHVLAGHAQASLDASVIVAQHCSNTASEQLINSLLLSPDAKVGTKPNLKIYHDNVECSHGSTCSDLDAESLFYLESRGLHPEQARRMLTEAFALEVATAHPAGALRDTFLQTVQTALARISV